MNNDLNRAEQYLTKAWSSAHRIGDDVDENLKTCLVYLSSGLLSLATAQSQMLREAEQQAAPGYPNPATHIRTRNGIRLDFTDQ